MNKRWNICASHGTLPQAYIAYQGEGYHLTYEQASFVAEAASNYDNLRAINAELVAALQDAYRLIIRFEAHNGCMDAEQLAKAEREAETIASFGHGRWIGDTVYCDMNKIRDLLKGIENANR